MFPLVPDEFLLYLYALAQLVKLMQKRPDWPGVLLTLTAIAAAIVALLGVWQRTQGGEGDEE